jgi:hypothetical protein
VFTEAFVSIDGTQVFNVRGFDLSCSNNLAEKRVLQQSVRPLKHTGAQFTARGTLSTFFEDEIALRKAEGVVGSSYPFEAGTILGVGAVVLRFTNGPDVLEFSMPNCEFEAGMPDVSDPAYVMQEVIVEARDVPNAVATISSFKATLTNAMAVVQPATRSPIV